MKRAVLAIVVLLLAAACGSTTHNNKAITAGATDAPVASASADTSASPGAKNGTTTSNGSTGTATTGTTGSSNHGNTPTSTVKSVTGPIEIGFLNTSVSNAVAMGGNNGETHSPEEVFRALVKAYNAKGGFAGRKIVPYVTDTDTATDRWETDYSAACENFTHDHHVSAVLGYSFVLIDSFEACLAKAGVTHINGGYNVGDETTLHDYPSMFASANPTADKRYLVQLQSAVTDGNLKPTNKLGLVLDDCAPDWRAYNRTVVPYIAKAHLNVAAKTVLSCPDGSTDVSPLVTQLNNAVLQFHEKGVDRVFIDGIPFIFFANTAEGQGWYPGYLLSSATGGAVLDANPVPERQLEHIHAAGWLPYTDVSASKRPAQTAAEKQCFALLKSQGIVPAQYNDYMNAYTTCDAFFMYDRALRASHGVATASVVRSAIEAFGTTYAGPSAHDGKTSYGPGDHDAVSVYRPWTYKKDCTCFLYVGAARPMP